MLQLKAKNIDIYRIGKLLIRYGVKANISDDVITIDGNITDEMLESLLCSVEINTISNYSSCKTKQNCELKEDTNYQEHNSKFEKVSKDYDSIYADVKRGEVYWCDLDPILGCEQGGSRPVVIVQNDEGNEHSDTTIVLVCTTSHIKIGSTQYRCFFNSITMEQEPVSFFHRPNTIMAEHIRTIDKKRLREYVGTLKPEVMSELEKKMCVSLYLNQEVEPEVREKIVYVDKPVEKIVYVDKPVLVKADINPNTEIERKDVNMNQVQILSLVDISELMKISQENIPYKSKVEKIVKLFGFDLEKNGVQYLVQAIIVSPKYKYFNLETLTELISKEKEVDAEEIKRLIVARVKETLHFKKAPTIDFIRLINAFVKQEDYDETNN